MPPATVIPWELSYFLTWNRNSLQSTRQIFFLLLTLSYFDFWEQSSLITLGEILQLQARHRMTQWLRNTILSDEAGSLWIIQNRWFKSLSSYKAEKYCYIAPALSSRHDGQNVTALHIDLSHWEEGPATDCPGSCRRACRCGGVSLPAEPGPCSKRIHYHRDDVIKR